MTRVYVLFVAIVLGSCSSSSRDRRALGEASRCYLKKHSSRDYYQVYYKDRLLFDNWYDEDYAQKLMMQAIKRGSCR